MRGGEAGQEGAAPRAPTSEGIQGLFFAQRPNRPSGGTLPSSFHSLPLFFSHSLSPIPERARRGGGRPAGALCKSWCWVGGEGEREEGEINLFGWSRVRVSRFPYPGIAGGAAIGSEDHVGP